MTDEPRPSEKRAGSRTSPHLRLGRVGEQLAARHLERAGYTILARNIRAGGVEIDLVAARGRLRAFVEVKTRRGRRFGMPEEAVDARKRSRLFRGARAWLRDNPAPGARIRFDVIAVEIRPDGGLLLRHLPGAFDDD